jgi:hypothetical protein
MSYTLTIQHFTKNEIEFFEFTNIADALRVMYEHCEVRGYDITPDNEGNFVAGGIGYDMRIELNSNF